MAVKPGRPITKDCWKWALALLSFLLLLSAQSAIAQKPPAPPESTANELIAPPSQESAATPSLATDVGVPASDVGVPASNVGTPTMDALPPSYTDEQMTYHVAGNVVNVDTDIKITSPTASSQWVSNTKNTVKWTGTKPERFSFQLINDDPHIRQTGISLRASVETKDGSADCDVPKLKPGSGWWVRFYDQLNISQTIAVSEKFSIVNTTSNALGGADSSVSIDNTTGSGSFSAPLSFNESSNHFGKNGTAGANESSKTLNLHSSVVLLGTLSMTVSLVAILHVIT